MGTLFLAILIGEIPYENQSWTHFKKFFTKVVNFEMKSNSLVSFNKNGFSIGVAWEESLSFNHIILAPQ